MDVERKLRCLMLTELFLPTKGGTAVSFDDDFRRLGGKEVHIVTADVPGARELDLGHPNSVYRLRLERVPWLKPESLLIYAKFLFKSLVLVAANRFDAVFAGRALPEGLVALLVGRLARLPVLIYAHGEELTGWGRGWKFKAMCFTMRRADALLSNSDYTRDTLVNLLGVESGRVELTYPTVDEQRFRPGLPCDDLRVGLGLRPGQPLILSVGRLMKRKGFDNVIRALPRLVARGVDAHYAVIGIGEEEAYLQGLVDELGIGDRVHLLGHVPYEDLPRWYCACSLFAMPNRDIGGDTEGFGLVFLEAASAGRPALAGTAGGTGSAVVDGVTGLRVDGESLESIEHGLARLLANSAEAEQMGRAGRERVVGFYTHQRRVEQLRSLARRGRYRAGTRAEGGSSGKASTT
jgi:phosphatidylinositol alpha-1,6-mannosyltransferase